MIRFALPASMGIAFALAAWAQNPVELEPIGRQIRAGIQLRLERRWDDAEKALRGAYTRAIARSPEDPNVAAAANQLGILYQALGQFPDAEHFYLAALRLTDLHADHAGSLIVANNLATLYLDNRLAARISRLDLLERTALVSPGPETARAKATLATLAMAQGDSLRAESLLTEVLPVLEARGTHVDAILARCNLGLIAARTGRVAEGIAKVEQCLALFDPQSREPAYAKVLGELSVVYADAGSREQAVRAAEKAASLSNSILGPTSPATAVVLEYCSYAMKKAGRKSEARHYLREASEIVRSSHLQTRVEVSDLLPRSKPK